MSSNVKYNKITSILTIVVLLILPAYFLYQFYFPDASKNTKVTLEYVGKEACIECHQKAYNDWLGSDHDLAMDYANDTTVLGDFNNATLTRDNQTHKCYKKDNKFFVYTDGADGSMKEFEVKYVFGYYPLQQYMVEFEGGRLQVLALTWSTIDTNWYYMADSVYQGLGVDHTNWLHWTNQAQNWNSMCADCHSTNLKKGYELNTDSYNTTWSEIDVSCEACHGPSSEHIRWANLAEYARQDFINFGLPIQTSGIDNRQYVDNCARCHSRRSALSDPPPNSQSIFNHIIPSLPTEPNWYIDGQIKEEDYVYASFTQSKMFMNDIMCNDCHNVHSGKLVLDGNKLCLQCHKSDIYNTPDHTFHKNYGETGNAVISDAGVKYEVGSGTECVNCHMAGQNYMGVDFRRDHSFRIPRPDLSDKMGTPNACNRCHTDKTNQWSQDYIEKWFGQSRPFEFGEAFFAAIGQDTAADKKLYGIINDDLYPTSIKSVAISYLSNSAKNDDLIRQSLQNIEPSVRITAINKLNLKTENDLQKLLPLLNDETKAVRIEVSKRLSSLDPNLIPESYKEVYSRVNAERLDVLEYNADFPTGKYNLANYYLQEKDYKKAEYFYLEAIKQDNELYMAKLNLGNLYSIVGEPLKAEKILEDLVLSNPDNGAALYNFGLILSENHKYQKSLEYLIKASSLLTSNGRVDYNIAMLYDFFGDKAKTEEYLLNAIKKEDTNYSNYTNLLNFYAQNGKYNQAADLTEEIKRKFPNQ